MDMRRVPAIALSCGLLACPDAPGAGGPDEARLVTVEVSPSPVRLALGESVTLRATGTYEDRGRADLTADATWTSSTPGIANPVDARIEPGRIRGNFLGTALITARHGPVGGVAEVTVTEATPIALWLEPEALALVPGDAVELRATAGWSDGARSDMAAQVAYTSARPEVATVQDGILYAHEPGETRIVARYGRTASPVVPVTVLEATPNDVRVDAVSAHHDAQLYVFHVTVGNGAQVGVPGFRLDLYTGEHPDLDAIGPVSRWIPYLGPSTRETHLLVLDVPSDDKQALTVVVDGDRVTADAYRNNNRFGAPLNDIASTTAASDLVVSRLRARASPEAAFVATDVTNLGSRGTTGFYVDVLLDQLAPPYLGQISDDWAKVASLGAGQTAPADVVVPLEPGECPFCRTWVVVDSLGHVPEADTANNVGGPTGLIGP